MCEAGTHWSWLLRKGQGWQRDMGAHPSLPSLSPARLNASAVPGSFLALPLTPDMTLGQTLNSCSGLCLLLGPKQRKGPAYHCLGLPEGPKGKRRKRVRWVGTATSENPHTVLHQVPQSSLLQSPSPPLRLGDSSILAQKLRPQHLLNPLWGAELSWRG